MSIYYIKQDNTVWCCEEDSGPYHQEIDISFVKCECPQVEPETMAEHLQGHQGGGQVLKWRKANENERSAWYGGKDEVFDDGIAFERERIIKLLEIGGPIEQIICDYWGDPEFDKDDALMLIEKAIKGEK